MRGLRARPASRRSARPSRTAATRSAAAAARPRGCTGTHSSSQPCMSLAVGRRRARSSSASIRNRARAPRCSRAQSDSPQPMIVGVTKSPCSAAACMTKPLRNSSPTSGSKTTAVANKASRPVADAGQLLDVLARRLPDRVVLPDVLVRGAVEALDLVGDVEVVEDDVLREAQLVHRADGTSRC